MISPNAIRLLNLGPTLWARTQSVYRATAELFAAESHGTVIFSQPLHRYLTYGVDRSASDVFDLAACARLDLPVARRPFPGGPEYHDVNHLLFQWILPVNGDRQPIVEGALAALGELGVPADYGRDQFTVRGARVGTLAGGAYESANVFLGCLYLTYDSAVLSQAWREPINENVTTLWAEAPRPISPDVLQDALLEHFARATGRPIERDKPRVEETQRAKEIEMELLGIETEAMPPD